MKNIFPLIIICLIGCNQNRHKFLAKNNDTAFLKAFQSADMLSWYKNRNSDNTNEMLISEIKDIFPSNTNKIKPILQAAYTAKSLSDTLVNKITGLKSKLAEALFHEQNEGKWADTLIGIPTSEGSSRILDSIMMGNKEHGPEGDAHRLKLLLNDYRKNMVSLIDQIGTPQDTMAFHINLLTPNVYDLREHHKESWEEYYFGGNIFAADITTLTLMQTEVRDSETAFLVFFLKMTRLL